jgi:hypothetical protein
MASTQYLNYIAIHPRLQCCCCCYPHRVHYLTGGLPCSASAASSVPLIVPSVYLSELSWWSAEYYAQGLVPIHLKAY